MLRVVESVRVVVLSVADVEPEPMVDPELVEPAAGAAALPEDVLGVVVVVVLLLPVPLAPMVDGELGDEEEEDEELGMEVEPAPAPADGEVDGGEPARSLATPALPLPPELGALEPAGGVL